jgi:hypothetical protein
LGNAFSALGSVTQQIVGSPSPSPAAQEAQLQLNASNTAETTLLSNAQQEDENYQQQQSLINTRNQQENSLNNIQQTLKTNPVLPGQMLKMAPNPLLPLASLKGK